MNDYYITINDIDYMNAMNDKIDINTEKYECVICLEITNKNFSVFECTKYHHICRHCMPIYKKKFENFNCPVCRANPIHESCNTFLTNKLSEFADYIKILLKNLC